MTVEGHRPLGAERGLRRRRAALPAGPQDAARQDQRERRRHRHGPSAGRHRRDDPGHAARRAGAAQPLDRPRHALRRRRHGHRDRSSSASEPQEYEPWIQLHRSNVDSDGIATITWDMPGRTHERAERGLDDGLCRRARGARSRTTRSRASSDLGQGRLHRRRRPRDAAGHRHVGRRQADGPVQPAAEAVPPPGDRRQADRGGDQRHGAGRRLRDLPRLPLPHRRGQPARPSSASPRSRSACCRAAAARSASRA